MDTGLPLQYTARECLPFFLKQVVLLSEMSGEIPFCMY